MKLVLCVLALLPFITSASVVTGQVVGQPHAIDDINEISEVVKMAEAEYNKRTNSVYPHKTVAILSPSKQLVAGLKYTFTLHLQPSCSEDGKACPEKTTTTKLIVTAIHQAWQREKHPEREWQFDFKAAE